MKRIVVQVSLMASILASVAAGAVAPSPIAPQPITKQDWTSIERGLGCTFDAGGKTLVVVNTEKAIVKPGGHLLGFRMDQNRGLAIINYGGNFGDSAIRVLIDRDDEPFGHGEESATSHARLTIRGYGQESTVTGTWTCGA